MTKRPPRSRRKEARPEELLAAALDTFSDKGFAAARMEDVAVRAGVSKGTIYLYYPSKQALFEALVRQNLLPRLDHVEKLTGAGAGKASDQLRLIVSVMGEIISDPRRVAIPKLVIAEAQNFPELALFYRREVVGRGIAVIEGILERGVMDGEFTVRDSHLTARLFVAPILMTALWQTTFAPVEDAPVAPEDVLQCHINMFLRAVSSDRSGGAPS